MPKINKYHEDVFVSNAFSNYLSFRTSLGPLAFQAAADSLLETEQRNELSKLVEKYERGDLDVKD